MNLHHLKVFHAVANARNFSEAAQRLYISQPAVSTQVRRLEESLGVPLVEVLGRQISLTIAGARLKEFADQIFRLDQDAEAAMAEFLDPGRGRIRLGASTTPGTYLVPRAMAGFRSKYPGVVVSLVLSNTQAVESSLLAGDLDLGIVGEDASHRADLVLEPWYSDRLVVIAPPDHPLGRPAVIPPDRLLTQPLILREPGSSTREVFMAKMAALHLPVVATLELAGTEAIKEAVAAGLGIGVVSSLAAREDLRTGRLALVTVEGLALERRLHLAWHRGKRLTRAGAAFLSFLQELPQT